MKDSMRESTREENNSKGCVVDKAKQPPEKLAVVKQMSLDDELKELLAEEKKVEFETMKVFNDAEKNGKYDQCWRIYDDLIAALSSNQ